LVMELRGDCRDCCGTAGIKALGADPRV